MLAIRGHLFYNISITNNHSPIIMNLSTEYKEPVNRIKQRILSNDNFENVAYVCCDWEEFVFEVAEWGVDHIAQVDFDSFCLLYTSPSPRDISGSRMPSSA